MLLPRVSMQGPTDFDAAHWPELWQAVIRILSEAVEAQQLHAWIKPLRFESIEPTSSGMQIHLSAPHSWSAKWVSEHYQKQIEASFSQITGHPCELQISVREATNSELQADPERQIHSFLADPVPSQNPSAKTPTATSRGISDNPLNPKFNFDTYIVGASNQFAHASALAVAEHPGQQYNPLFMYSPPGLGKTHLMHAIGNLFLKDHPNGRVAYLSAEQFVNELIESIRLQKMPQFRNKYRNSYDLILIDDIQFIAGKKSSEDEFFHTFNALHSSRRQIVVTSDRPPKEIESLEERVRTRFLSGLVADIQPPEIETRIAILKAKAERDDVYLPDDVATFLATHVKSNVRELEGTLIRLKMQASLSGAEISMEMAKHELKSAIPEEGSHITAETIQAVVAKHFNLKVNDLKSTSRTRTVTIPRHIAMYLIRKYTGIAFKDIGQYFGGRDHSSIQHACSKIEEEVETNHEIREWVETIQNQL